MTSSASQVSLHCIICYEQFDLKDRHPVVLPCGHTYVCVVCAKRLKKCMECREPLFWNPPKAPPASSMMMMNHHQHHHPSALQHRSPAHSRYSTTRTVGRMSAARFSPAPQTPPHPSMAVTAGTGTASASNNNNSNNNSGNATGTVLADEPMPLPLPKNLVLMEMIEAKERQQRLLREAKRQEQEHTLQRQQEAQLQKLQEALEGGDGHEVDVVVVEDNLIDAEAEEEDDDDDDEEEEDWLLDPTLSGMAAFSGSCGTYVVREPLGLVVLPLDPNRRHQQPAEASDVYEKTLSHHPEQQQQQQHSYMKAPQPLPTTPDQDEKKEAAFGEEGHPSTGRGYRHPQPTFHKQSHYDDENNNNSEDDNDNSDNDDDDAVVPRRPQHPKEPFSLEEGQKVQVVGVEEGVYQLARGAGYIVATGNQLVKVGGPLETSCKLEGMLQSVTQKQMEVQQQLDEINRLARGLREKIVLEQAHPEDHPVITAPKHAHFLDGQLMTTDNHLPTIPDTLHPTTPTKYRTTNNSSPNTGGSGGNQSMASDTSTHVELGAPRTPGPPQSSGTGPFLEMDHGSGSGSYSGYDQYVNSPAHSCPMPTVNASANLSQPFIDGTPTGLPRYRVNSDDDLYGLGWAGALGCGSTLFGERLLESSRQGTNNILNAAAGSDILALSFDENSLLDHASARNRAASLAAAAGAHTGSQDSPLRSGGSFDGVNFRTGMSGHSGVSQPKRNRNAHHTGMIHSSAATLPRRQIRMMSEHRGVAQVRGTAPPAGLKRRTTPDALIGSQDYY
ncbi:zinc finger C3HC4 type domain containing protein [Nitzschia inconspicua]|uniref:Zinc finger C3HC4 type domain containing protein n=1 Tax=Nitzschia inconspicua TaxID=303405 RepID=A0A9K3LJP5_9STRA|nr:zinc finger C3HC4 type domain containing protein [Nitzschia inconspicua]